jgi:hypothetical protein
VSEAAGPVTLVITRRVKAGHETAYEDWLRRTTEAFRGHAGYRGVDIQRPALGAPREYTSVLRFDDVASLRAFERSPERARLVAEVAPHVEADAVWQQATGLEFWFSPPPGTVVAQPSRLRMALVMIVVVFGLVLSIGAAVNLLLGALPYALRLFVTIVVEVFLMTYVLMPVLTRRLARWIYPRTRTA